MNFDDIFRDIFDQFDSLSIYDDWRRIQADFEGEEEKRKIQRIIVRVACHGLDMYEAGKEIEALNPCQTSNFPQFLLKFLNTLQMAPIDQQTPLNAHLLLKFIDFFAENPSKCAEESLGSRFLEISRLLDTAGNILIKDLLENALKSRPEDSGALGARELLDGLVVMAKEDLEAEQFEEPAFLRLKQKLTDLCATPDSTTLLEIENTPKN